MVGREVLRDPPVLDLGQHLRRPRAPPARRAPCMSWPVTGSVFGCQPRALGQRLGERRAGVVGGILGRGEAHEVGVALRAEPMQRLPARGRRSRASGGSGSPVSAGSLSASRLERRQRDATSPGSTRAARAAGRRGAAASRPAGASASSRARRSRSGVARHDLREHAGLGHQPRAPAADPSPPAACSISACTRSPESCAISGAAAAQAGSASASAGSRP